VNLLALYFGALAVLTVAALVGYAVFVFHRRRLRRQKRNGYRVLHDVASRTSHRRDHASPSQ
jgi:hypothetical protein